MRAWTYGYQTGDSLNPLGQGFVLFYCWDPLQDKCEDMFNPFWMQAGIEGSERTKK